MKQHRLCNLVAEIYTGGNNEGLGANKFDEVLLVYSPLAQNRCSTLLKSPDLSPDDRAILLKQWLEGIAFLHTRGLIHRDINPNNMVVVSRRPPRGVLIDLGAATWEQSSTNHMAGTIPFLAPEVMALKLSLSSPPYDKTVDIWSFGITSYLLICQRFPFWKEMDRSTYTKIREELLAKGRDPIIALTEQMLRWNPRDRISAADAVLHPALRNVDAGAESKERLGSK